jgi:hypothetical protein
MIRAGKSRIHLTDNFAARSWRSGDDPLPF